MAKKTKTKKNSNTATQAQEPVREKSEVLTRIRPLGVQEDGRMYYQSDTGLLMTVSKMPYLSVRSILKSLEDENSSVYQYVESTNPDDGIEKLRDDMRGRLEDAGKKCERALQRLKDKGLHRTSIDGLRVLMAETLPRNLGWPMDVVLDMNLGLTGLDDWDADIPDEFWLNAIELSVYLLQREAYLNSADSGQWGVYVSQNIEFIWILVYLTTYGNALYMDMKHAKSEIDAAKARVDEIFALKDVIDGLRAVIRQQSVDFGKKIESRASELESLRVDNGRLARENMKLKLKLELMEAAASESEFEANQEFDAADLEYNQDDKADDNFKMQLPEENILFVGGHVRLQNKLKQLHPKWKFVSTKMSYSLLDDNVKSRFVFLYTGHMSHKLFDKVRASLESVPMAYVTSQNMNLLHGEMLKAYNEYYENLSMPEF